MPAFAELPITSVVQPAYHALPKGGHGSFCPSASRRLSCVRVFATTGGGSERGSKHRQSEGSYTFGGICYRFEGVSTWSSRIMCRVRSGLPISTAPAVEPAMMLRRGLGPFLGAFCASLSFAIGHSRPGPCGEVDGCCPECCFFFLRNMLHVMVGAGYQYCGRNVPGVSVRLGRIGREAESASIHPSGQVSTLPLYSWEIRWKRYFLPI